MACRSLRPGVRRAAGYPAFTRLGLRFRLYATSIKAKFGSLCRSAIPHLADRASSPGPYLYARPGDAVF
jgi:hypothetical protein